jgi:ADP-heptose:LPS heptosyltransferase
MIPTGTLPTARLQTIDRWLGVPACLLLTWLRRLLGSAASPAASRPRNILFIKLAEQGSTVLAAAAIQQAVDMVGRENVYFTVFAENRFILDVLDLIPAQNVFPIAADGFGQLARSSWQTLRAIRRMRFDAAIDLEFFARSSAAFAFLTGAVRRVGFHTFYGEGPYRGDLMTHRLLYNPYLHTSQIFALMVAALAADPANLPTFGTKPPDLDASGPIFQPRHAETGEVQALLLKETGGRSATAPLILLNANASDLLPLRRWAPARYVALARRLLDEFPAACVLMTGAPAEAPAAESLVAEIGSRRCISMAGKTTLRQLLVLYSLSDLLVTNDSGPAHFASLTPIHVVTLFGPETPRLFAALTSRNTPLWSGVACSPCVNAYNNRQSPCQDNVCMQQISVDEVFAAAAHSMRQRLGTMEHSDQIAAL